MILVVYKYTNRLAKAQTTAPRDIYIHWVLPPLMVPYINQIFKSK